MTLLDMHNIIEGQLGMCPRKGGDAVVVGSTFGGTPTVPMRYCGCGIDWNDGKFIITTVVPLHKAE